MKKYLIILIFAAFIINNAQTKIDSNIASDTIKTAAEKSGQVVKPSNNESVKSADENSPSIIEEGGVKEKLTNIFSISKIFWAITFLIISYYGIKFITIILDKLSEKSTKYRIGLKGLIPIFRISSWTFSLTIVIAVIIAPPVESLVVVAGSLGIAIGLASQDIIKNVFGGIITLFDRPFQVGDKVEVGNYYGEVKSIGLRSTRIVTPDDSIISIPNGNIMTESVSNANAGEADCQVVAEIYLPPYVDLAKVREIGIKAAQVSKYIFLNKPIAVIFKNEFLYNRSVIKMRLKAYVLDIRYEFPFMSDMTEVTIRELLKHGIVTKEEISGLGV
ncbi:MAG: mechanosensitive ion channel family protein [Bacteroidetes bacterium]|nr:mechanosensitive ion channel family protein [Bacteroidota bacterium]